MSDTRKERCKERTSKNESTNVDEFGHVHLALDQTAPSPSIEETVLRYRNSGSATISTDEGIIRIPSSLETTVIEELPATTRPPVPPKQPKPRPGYGTHRPTQFTGDSGAEVPQRKYLPMRVMVSVLDCLRYDKRTLSVASRISRRWRAPAQRRLFTSLTIWADTPGFLKKARDIKACANFFSNNAHLGHFVSTLTIGLKDPYARHAEIRIDDQFIRLLACFPTLQHITLMNGIASAPSFKHDEELRALFLSIGRHLETADVKWVMAEPKAGFRLSNILRPQDTLEITNSTVWKTGLSPGQNSLLLKHFKYKGYLENFPSVEDEVPDLSRLEKFSCDLTGVTGSKGRPYVDAREGYLNLDKFFTTYANSLRFFRCDISHMDILHFDILNRTLAIYDLKTYAPNLEVVHLGFRLTVISTDTLEPVDFEKFVFTIAFVSRLVRGLPWRVREIVLGISVHEIQYKPGMKRTDPATAAPLFHELDIIFHPKYTPGLKKVQLLANMSGKLSKMEDWHGLLEETFRYELRKRLPLLSKRGILQCC